MKKYETHIKKFLLAALLGALFIPLLQFKMEFIKEKNLGGAVKKIDKVWFTQEKWVSGIYQDSTLMWFNENFGFRNTAVRLRNQILWAFDKQARTRSVITGKENYMYEENYIFAYTGKDFKGEQHWNTLTGRLKKLQDSLLKKNITLVVTMAPCKASFYPEYIPDRFGPAAQKTNYFSLSSGLNNRGVNFIDFNAWFLKLKKNTPFPLYSKGGIHWSRYGSILAVDSLLKFLKQKTGMNLSMLKIRDTKFADTIQPPDNDIGEAMNLLFPLPKTRMAYSEFDYEVPNGADQPGLYVVSDSYFWQIYNQRLTPRVFKNIQFSYYNNQLFDSDSSKIWEFANAGDVHFDLKRNKIVLLMVTESNLSSFPWRFLEKMDKDMNPETLNLQFLKRVAEYEEKIKRDPNWLKDITVKAKNHNVTVDSMIKANAVWMAQQEKK